MADKSRDAFGGSWATEQDVQPPLVERAGRMDIVGWLDGAPLLIDTVVPSNVTTDAQELKRRMVDATRAVRAAERKKKTRYGATVLGAAVEDTGRVGAGLQRYLRRLAARLDEDEPARGYRQLMSEVQWVVLGATTRMLQGARRCQS